MQRFEIPKPARGCFATASVTNPPRAALGYTRTPSPQHVTASCSFQFPLLTIVDY